MRVRSVLVAVALALGALAFPATASTSPQARTLSYAYTAAQGTTAGAVLSRTVAVRRDEVLFRLAAHDDAGGAVALRFTFQHPGDGPRTMTVCDAMSRPAAVVPGSTVRVSVVAGHCPDGRVAVPTRGTLSVQLLRARPVVPPAKRWAVVIGITDYAGRTHDTAGGRGDAVTIRDTLLRNGWRADHIRMLTDRQATYGAVVGAMRWLAARSGPDTFSVFHFSGHVCIAGRGPCPAGHYYLWTAENRFVSEQVVGAELSRVRGHAWLDFQGCEAAGFAVPGLATGHRMVTASSRADEKSYEEPRWGESVWVGFTWDRGLRRGAADADGDGHVTIGEAVAYGRAQAPRYTAQGAYGPQHPYVLGGSPAWRLDAPPSG